MNIDLKEINKLQTMLAEYKKINGTVSANMSDAINAVVQEPILQPMIMYRQIGSANRFWDASKSTMLTVTEEL